MLTNYFKDDFGIINQIKQEPYTYDVDYVKRNLDNLGEKLIQLSYLRLGYLLGVIKEIPKSILDVGYGNGSFLRACTNIIKDCSGNDISDYSLPERCKFVPDIFSRHFSVITFFDSLEHFPDISFISKLKCDYVLISVPWCHYFSDDWFDLWRHRKPNEHLHHFNKESLQKFFESNGFQMLDFSNIEDTVRKSDSKNILSAVFRKIK